MDNYYMIYGTQVMMLYLGKWGLMQRKYYLGMNKEQNRKVTFSYFG